MSKPTGMDAPAADHTRSDRPAAATAVKTPRGAPRKPRQPRQPRKPGANREAIMAAAATVFLERGYTNASLDDIAQRVGISKPTIYYRVGSKEALLVECLRESISALQAQLNIIEAADLCGADQLEQAVRYCVEMACTEFGRCAVRIPDHVLTERRAEVAAIKHAVAQTLSDLHRKAVADGSLGGSDSPLTGRLLRGLINSVADWYNPLGPMQPPDIGDAIVAMAITPLRTQPQSR